MKGDGLKTAGILFAICLAVSFLPGNTTSITVAYLVPHDWIEIFNDDNFTAENGVTGGNGTYDNPYTIDNMVIDLSQNVAGQSHTGIYIANTHAFFVIRNVRVHSGLVNLSQPNDTGMFSFTGGYGIMLQNLVNGIVENSELTDNLRGLRIESCDNIVVRNNDILRNFQGLDASGSRWLHVEGNNISSNINGNVEFDQVLQSYLVNNTIMLTPQYMGINLYSSEGCEVHGNEITFNKNIGVNVGFCKDCKITNNTIAYNGVGITIYGSEDTLALPNGFSFNHKDIENWDDDNGTIPWTLLISGIVMVAAVIVVIGLMMLRQKKKPASIQAPPMIDGRT
jgi:parallel beta-helix repeat protein